MQKFKKLIEKREIEVKPAYSILLIVILSLLLTLFMLWLQPDGITDVFKCIRENNGLSLLLNWLPVLAAMLLVYFISSSFIASVTIVGFLGVAMGVINRLKIMFRNDPFMPWDISLVGEAAGIAKSFGIKMIMAAITVVILYIAASLIAACFIRSKRLDTKLRVVGSIVCILAAVLLNKPLYKNNTTHNNLYVIGNIYNQVAQFNSKGFLYSYIYTYNTSKITRPAGYNMESVKQKTSEADISGIDSIKNMKKPHIIMIMGEAYSEIALNPSLDFTGFVDPMENYKRIKQESIYGQIAVPNIGGGTADTEFDVLTGLATRHFRGVPFSFRLVSKEFEALPSILNSIGYRSEALHPGHAWFYNRQNVFKDFGFEETIFIDAFSDDQNKGMYINEVATTDKLLEMYEKSIEQYPDMPFYGFCVTIQNHGPYNDKYLVDLNFTTTVNINENDINAMSNYFEGVIDADLQLDRITKYFEGTNEPVVLIYFGDHLPAFTQNVYSEFYPDIYEEGSAESLARLNKTPFIIWQNTAAKQSTSIDDNFEKLNMPDNMVISSNYLGAYVLELLGYHNVSPFMDYVNILRSDYPVIMENQSFKADGTSTEHIGAAEKKDLILFRDWEFYKIFDE